MSTSTQYILNSEHVPIEATSDEWNDWVGGPDDISIKTRWAFTPKITTTFITEFTGFEGEGWCTGCKLERWAVEVITPLLEFRSDRVTFKTSKASHDLVRLEWSDQIQNVRTKDEAARDHRAIVGDVIRAWLTFRVRAAQK